MIKIRKPGIQIIAGCVMVLACFILFSGRAKASSLVSPVQIVSVDYEEENIVVKNNGNTRIYFETEIEAAKNNWEVIDAESNLDDTTIIDISWLSPSVSNILKIKGNINEQQARINVKERTAKFEVSINYTNINSLSKGNTIGPLLNIMTSEGNASDPITFDNLEWKKGDNGKWKQIEDLTLDQLEKYQIKGTNLFIRLKAVNDDWNGVVSADGTKGRRPSNGVKIKIAKKSNPMVVGINGGVFKADIKYGKEYRVTVDTNNDGSLTDETASDWIQVIDKATKTIPLAVIDPTNADGITRPFGEMIIEIRDYSTAKLAASKITEIHLDAQRTLGGAIVVAKVPVGTTSADKDIYVSYSGVKNMNITIPSASLESPYEYCIFKEGAAFDLERASWTSITKGTDVKILASKAVDGGTLYVRQKEIKAVLATKTRAAVSYQLASTIAQYKIKYPSVPDVEDKSFTFVKGYADPAKPISFTVKLNSAGRNPFETQIKNIKLGSREIEFTSTVTPVLTDPIDNSKEYIMTVKLADSSLASMTNCSNKLISISFENGTVDKVSIKLTIMNPTPAFSLTATIGKGSSVGTTKVNLISTPGTNNRWAYKIGTTEIKIQNTQDVITGATTFLSGDSIPVAAGNYLMLYELTPSDQVVKYRCIQITADMINPGP